MRVVTVYVALLLRRYNVDLVVTILIADVTVGPGGYHTFAQTRYVYRLPHRLRCRCDYPGRCVVTGADGYWPAVVLGDLVTALDAPVIADVVGVRTASPLASRILIRYTFDLVFPAHAADVRWTTLPQFRYTHFVPLRWLVDYRCLFTQLLLDCCCILYLTLFPDAVIYVALIYHVVGYVDSHSSYGSTLWPLHVVPDCVTFTLIALIGGQATVTLLVDLYGLPDYAFPDSGLIYVD